MKITEEMLEDHCMVWFGSLGYQTLHGGDLEPTGKTPERQSLSDVVLKPRLKKSLMKINPHLPEDCIDTAIDTLLTSVPSVAHANHTFHRQLIDGIQVEYEDSEGHPKGDKVYLVDFTNQNNDWLALRQFSVDGVTNGEKDNRRPDIVVFLNGLPISVLELKSPADEKADVWKAYNQIQTYKNVLRDLFVFNESVIISDGTEAYIGSLTADRDRFTPWRTIDGTRDDSEDTLALEVMVRGFFNQEMLLDYLQYFISFECDNEKVIKKIAGYHQFHGVRAAIESTIRATRHDGDQRCGVFWHTQGSGKSLSMGFYSAKLMAAPEMRNPTIVVVTDRNDLDEQLFETFSINAELLRETPIQAKDRHHLKELLDNRQSGGIFFTTMQKFSPDEGETRYPALTERNNIVVMADEAHRSQYGLKARVDSKTGEMKYGYAQHLRDALPNAGFIGFTGTPVEMEDRDTRVVFGQDVSVYDIEQAQRDGATKKLYYESRLIKLNMNKNVKDEDIDQTVEDLVAEYDEDDQSKTKSKNAALEALVCAEDRIDRLARDLLSHFGKREEVTLTKAMAVCISREACVQLYDKLRELKPEWHDDDPEKGCMKVIMTGTSSDPEKYQKHIHKKPIQRKIAKRVKNPDNELKLIIVCDMWLTGFDAPCLNTIYIDKPLKGHNLMQAIARVNRVFRDKEGGLIVDYLGIAPELRNAIRNYTASGKGEPTIDLAKALEVTMTKLDVCRGIMHGFDYSDYKTNTLGLLAKAMNHILSLEDGKKRFDKAALSLSKAFSLCSCMDEAKDIKEEIAFFETLRAAIKKTTTSKQRMSDENVQTALRQVVSESIVSGDIVDVFQSAGLNKPEISILDDDFLAEVEKTEHKNLAVEMLKKLIQDEIKTRTVKNAVAYKTFSEMLRNSLDKYRNRSVETSVVIEELIKLAKELRDSADRGDELDLTKEELAFFDALLANESAKEAMKQEDILFIARELAAEIRKSAQPDWAKRKNLRSRMRIKIKQILKRTGYPPDCQEDAVELVLQQAELVNP
ncbi:type I restriction endonuclease subunit R [Vibrio vulnificus]|uniref:type I restriction endonuclease subunit R n=1 Tax=Vibrio vulnificus TaxID=672 RepID=UPI001FAFE7D8|nr:type I restriction endonuclease subunit R [Vibrio vulnificus]MCJ0805153.1 type I restriction endonuclease subunit R [Vibrio vulnificus]